MPRSAALLPGFAVAVLLLSGCGPQPAPTPTDDSPASSTPKPTEVVEAPVQLPADAVLGLTAHATADNGAEIDILVVVRQPLKWDAGEGAARAAATTAWCSGELEEAIYADQNWSFGQVDVTVTLAEGSAAWPTDLPIQVLPLPGGPSLASAGDVHQLEAPNESGDEGYYVPRCAQNAFIDGPGAGSTYLGFANDGAALTGWSTTYYGVTFDGFTGAADPSRVELSDCTQVGMTEKWPESFSATTCQVGTA